VASFKKSIIFLWKYHIWLMLIWLIMVTKSFDINFPNHTIACLMLWSELWRERLRSDPTVWEKPSDDLPNKEKTNFCNVYWENGSPFNSRWSDQRYKCIGVGKGWYWLIHRWRILCAKDVGMKDQGTGMILFGNKFNRNLKEITIIVKIL